MQCSIFLKIAVILLFILPAHASNKYRLNDVVVAQSVLGKLINNQKTSFEFQTNGQNTQSSDFVWDIASNKWVESERKIYTFDNLDRDTMWINQQYDTKTAQWKTNEKMAYGWDLYNNPTFNTYYSSSDNGANWKPIKHQISQKSSLGKNLLTTYFEWDSVAQKFIYSAKDTFIYNAAGQITSYTGFVFDTIFDEWVFFDQELYTYENSNNTINYLYQTFDLFSKTWVNNAKDLTIYTNNSANMNYQSYVWDKIKKLWVLDVKETYAYDASGKVKTFYQYIWEAATQRWIYEDREDYTYNADGTIATFIDYDKDSYQNVWVNNSREVYTYNANYKTADLLLPIIDSTYNASYFQGVTTSVDKSLWNAQTRIWAADQKYTFNYSNVTINSLSDNLPNNSWNIYPNPTSEKLQVVLPDNIAKADIMLFDAAGRCCYSKKGYIANSNISVSSLAKGYYLLQIKADNWSEMKSFLKR